MLSLGWIEAAGTASYWILGPFKYGSKSRACVTTCESSNPEKCCAWFVDALSTFHVFMAKFWGRLSSEEVNCLCREEKGKWGVQKFELLFKATICNVLSPDFYLVGLRILGPFDTADNLTPRTIWHFRQFDTIMASRTIWHHEGKEDNLTPKTIWHLGQFYTIMQNRTIWHHHAK